MMSVLDLQSVLETDSSAYVDTEWDNFSSQNNASSSSSSLALMHNVSMMQPVASSAAILSPAGDRQLLFSLLMPDCVFTLQFALPSSRRHLSYDDCLEDKRENYQNCSVLRTTVTHNDTRTHI